MSAEAAALTATFRVGRKYVVTATLKRPRPGVVGHSHFEWSPAMPAKLSKRELADYRRHRDALYAELAEATGVKIAVFDI